MSTFEGIYLTQEEEHLLTSILVHIVSENHTNPNPVTNEQIFHELCKRAELYDTVKALNVTLRKDIINAKKELESKDKYQKEKGACFLENISTVSDIFDEKTEKIYQESKTIANSIFLKSEDAPNAPQIKDPVRHIFLLGLIKKAEDVNFDIKKYAKDYLYACYEHLPDGYYQKISAMSLFFDSMDRFYEDASFREEIYNELRTSYSWMRPIGNIEVVIERLEKFYNISSPSLGGN